jgi:hypothetical protein
MEEGEYDALVREPKKCNVRLLVVISIDSVVIIKIARFDVDVKLI